MYLVIVEFVHNRSRSRKNPTSGEVVEVGSVVVQHEVKHPKPPTATPTTYLLREEHRRLRSTALRLSSCRSTGTHGRTNNNNGPAPGAPQSVNNQVTSTAGGTARGERGRGRRGPAGCSPLRTARAQFSCIRTLHAPRVGLRANKQVVTQV